MISKSSALLVPDLQFHDSLLSITKCHSYFTQNKPCTYFSASSFPVALRLLLRLLIKQILGDKFTVLFSIFILAVGLAIDLSEHALLSYLETYSFHLSFSNTKQLPKMYCLITLCKCFQKKSL